MQKTYEQRPNSAKADGRAPKNIPNIQGQTYDCHNLSSTRLKNEFRYFE